MIRFAIDADASVGMLIAIDVQTYQGTKSDADIIALTDDILNSDLVQNAENWNNTPSVSSILVDETRQIFPTP